VLLAGLQHVAVTSNADKWAKAAIYSTEPFAISLRWSLDNVLIPEYEEGPKWIPYLSHFFVAIRIVCASLEFDIARRDPKMR
jgi:hypothetical protein